MAAIVQFDSNFKLLIDHVAGIKPISNNSDIISTLARFRKGLSYQWYTSFENTFPIDNLSKAIRTILFFTGHSDATVRVNSYSTLGALLITIAPFCPINFINAFAQATQSLEVTPKVSIAVINMFVYLMRFISPVRINDLIDSLPVVHHFGVDVSEFLKYIPQIIPLMSNLPIEFHQNVLRSLMSSCGKTPNTFFANSVSLLVDLHRKQLINDLKLFLTSNKLDLAVVWLGPTIINNKENYDCLGEDGRELFLSKALPELNSAHLNLTRFEHACKTSSFFLSYQRGTDEYDKTKERILSSLLPEYSPIYQSRLLILPHSFQEICKPIDNESDSFKGMRLIALAGHFLETKEMPDETSKIFYDFRNSENDLYCTVVEQFSRCIKLFCQLCTQKYHIEMIKTVLEKRNKNWVHDEAVSHLIDSCSQISLDYIEPFYPQYRNTALNKLLEFNININDRLFETSLKSLLQFTTYRNLEIVLSSIFMSDWTNVDIVMRRFNLLAKIARIYKSNLFHQFIPIAYECINFFSEKEDIFAFSSLFEFLSEVNYCINEIPNDVKEHAFTFIAYHFQMYSKKYILPIDLTSIVNQTTVLSSLVNKPKYYVKIPKKAFIETVNSDIVTNPLLDHKAALSHVRNAFAFLASLTDSQLGEDREFLFQYALSLLPVFDQFALEVASKLAKGNLEMMDSVYNLSINTFLHTNRDEVAASCCDVFIKSAGQLNNEIAQMIEKFLLPDQTEDPCLIFRCFVICDQRDHEKAVKAVVPLIPRLPERVSCELLFKLVTVLRKDVADKIDEKHSIALLQFALNYGGNYTQRVLNYLQKNPFKLWPLDDPEMNEDLIQFLQKENLHFSQTIEDIKEMDLLHLEFMLAHSNFIKYDINELKIFAMENVTKFARISKLGFDIESKNLNLEYLDPIRSTKFIFNSTEFEQKIIDEKITRLSSASPSMYQNQIIECPVLLSGFFRFQGFNPKLKPISIETLLKSINYLSKHEKCESAIHNAIEYAYRCGLQIPVDLFTSNPNLFFGPKLLDITFAYLGQRNITFQSLPEEIQKLIQNQNLSYGELALLDSSYILNLLTSQDYRAHHLIELMPSLGRAKFDISSILNYFSKIIEQFKDLTSGKKQAAFIRFITGVLTGFRKSDPAGYESVSDLILASIPDLVSTYQPIYHEMAILFNFIMPKVKDTSVFIDYFTALDPNCFLYTTFLPYIAILTCFKKAPFPIPQFAHLEKAISKALPSSLCCIFRALFNYMSIQDGLELVKSLLPIIGRLFKSTSQCHLSGPYMVMFIQKLLSLNAPSLSWQISDFVKSFEVNFISDTSKASFRVSLSSASSFALRSSTYLTLLLTQDISIASGDDTLMRAILVAFDAINKQMMKNLKKAEKEGLKGKFKSKEIKNKIIALSLDVCEKLTEQMKKCGNITIGKALLKIMSDCGSNIDSPSLLMAKIACMITPSKFNGFLSILWLFYSQQSPKIKEMIRTLADAAVYQPSSRKESLNELLKENGNKNKAFLLACWESNDLSSFEKEYSNILL